MDESGDGRPAEPASAAPEMSAAEALARATEAAAEGTDAPPVEAAESAGSEPVDAVDTPVKATVETPVETPVEAPVDAPAEADPLAAEPADSQAAADTAETAPEPSADSADDDPATATASPTAESESKEPPGEAAASDEAKPASTEQPAGDDVQTAAEDPAEAANDEAHDPPIAAEATRPDPAEAGDEPAGPPATGEPAGETVAGAEAEQSAAADEAEPKVAEDPETKEAAAEAANAEPVEAEEPSPEDADAKPEASAKKKAAGAEKKSAEPAGPPPDRPELRVIYEALANRQPLTGRVIGWNSGGFHLALGDLAAFCPRSEMEIGEVEDPESYLDKEFEFRVLRLQGKGKRIVVSRAAHQRRQKSRQRNQLRKKLKVGAVLEGTVATLKEFGAFVDLGGSQGLVHVSEISHRRVEHPSHVLSEGQQVQVKVLRVEQGGRRISLSMRALEPDPWKDLGDRFPQGAVVKGTVERANQIGAFIELAPGLTGLLPARSMSIPRETSPARAYPPGKEVSVQIVSIDPRRQRIALALEGSGLEGSRNDYKEFKRKSRETGDGEGFNALASAFRRLQDGSD